MLNPLRSEAEAFRFLIYVVVIVGAIVGLVTADAQGGKSSFSFTKLKENVGLADKDFAFKIPRGVDVVTDGSRR